MPRLSRDRRRTGAIATAVVAIAAIASTAPAGAVEGGDPAPAGAYPFIGFVEAPSVGYCSASLVHESWVLTAAHCMEHDVHPGGRPKGTIRVTIGDSNVRDGVDEGEVRRVTRVAIHPDYDPGNGRYDIAMLKLDVPSTQPPVALAGPEDADLTDGSSVSLSDLLNPDYDPDLATLVGYGATCTDRDPDSACPFDGQLHHGQAVLLHDAAAHDELPFWKGDEYLNVANTATKTLGGEIDALACRGDSGSPVLVTTADGSFRQVGVFSWGMELPFPVVGNACWDRYASVHTQVHSNAIAGWVTAVANSDTVRVEVTRARLNLADDPGAERSVSDLSLSVSPLGEPHILQYDTATADIEPNVGWQAIDRTLVTPILDVHQLKVRARVAIDTRYPDLGPIRDPEFDLKPDPAGGFATSINPAAVDVLDRDQWNTVGLQTFTAEISGRWGALTVEYTIGSPIYVARPTTGTVTMTPRSPRTTTAAGGVLR